jgi:hypothetical protein
MFLKISEIQQPIFEEKLTGLQLPERISGGQHDLYDLSV